VSVPREHYDAAFNETAKRYPEAASALAFFRAASGLWSRKPNDEELAWGDKVISALVSAPSAVGKLSNEPQAEIPADANLSLDDRTALEEMHDRQSPSTPAPVPEDVIRRAKAIAEAHARSLPVHSVGYADESRQLIEKLASAGLLTGSAAEMRERCANVAEGFQAALNSEAMKPFAHDPTVASAVMRRDIEIAKAIRSLPLPQEKRDTGAREIDRPVAWRVRDCADGWIIYTDEAQAKFDADQRGARIEPLIIGGRHG
jgi:hypothetical protein